MRLSIDKRDRGYRFDLVKNKCVVYLNDVVLDESHKPIVSFVSQDDIVMPKETAVDAFRFSAGMRNAELSGDQIEAKVEQMITDLKLSKCRDTIMGVPGLLKGVSGGEKRRCNIGVELINNPPVIALDEPTSGLDSVAAYRIGKLMRALALLTIAIWPLSMPRMARFMRARRQVV